MVRILPSQGKDAGSSPVGNSNIGIKMSKVFCIDCEYRLKTIPYTGEKSNLCKAAPIHEINPIGKRTSFVMCIVKNAHNDCKDYKKKEPIWAKWFLTKR